MELILAKQAANFGDRIILRIKVSLDKSVLQIELMSIHGILAPIEYGFETRSCYVAPAGYELVAILMSQSPETWDDRYVLLCPANFLFEENTQ